MNQTRENKYFFFSAAELEKKACGLSVSYQEAKPWPHTVIDDFLPNEVAEEVLLGFPDPDHPIWIQKDPVHQPSKFGIANTSRLDEISPFLHHILFTFQSYPFVNFIEKLTGINKLITDHHLTGCLQQTISGGYLSVHADFNVLERINSYRRVNAILYLNKFWQKEYNGGLELWDNDSGKCEKTIEPVFNRLIVFNTDKSSPHGHPKPLKTPTGLTRKSIAFFYYTSTPVDGKQFDTKTDWFEGKT